MDKNPNAKPTENIAEAYELIAKDPTLKDMYSRGGKPLLKLAENFKYSKDFGSTATDEQFLTVEHIQFYHKAYNSYYKLYQTIGHELTHAIQITSKRYNAYYLQYGPKNARDYMEYEAWSWNYTMNQTDSTYFRVAKYHKNLFETYKHVKM